MFFVLFSLGFFMFLSGRWQGRFGTRKLLLLGTLVSASAMAVLPRLGSAKGLYVWGFLIGTGSCFIYIPALHAVQASFPTRKGLASGIFNTSFGISGAVMSPVFKALLDRAGYQNTGLILATLALAAGLAGQALTVSPSTVGPAGRARSMISEVLRERDFWTIWVVWALAGAAGISMVMNAVGFGLWRGFGPTEAVKLLVGFNLANGLSRTAAGYLSDLTGRTKVMALAFLASGLSYIALPYVPWPLAAVALSGCVGFGFGTLFAVSAPLLVERFGLERFGEVMGLAFTAYGFCSGLLGPVIAGLLHDLVGGRFELSFSYLGALYLVSALVLMLRPPAVPPGRTINCPKRRPRIDEGSN